MASNIRENVNGYRDRIIPLLEQIFGEKQVKKEWDVARNARDAYSRKLYCPRIDIAVSPFNINRKVKKNKKMIDDTYSCHKSFINKLSSVSRSKIRAEHNINPRCFLAIEIENKGGRKPRLGSIVNAAILGKVGIIVTFTEESDNSLRKIKKFLKFAETVHKTKVDISKNVIIITKEDFFKALGEYAQSAKKRAVRKFTSH